MPDFNKPDRFFISNFNLDVLYKLNKTVKEYLMSLNDSEKGLFDKQTAVNFSKINLVILSSMFV